MKPVAERERVASIDVLRGFALLGILLINITGFGLPIEAMHDPVPAGGASGANLAVWTITETLVNGTMYALFSMLFGAGVLLFTRGKESSNKDGMAAFFYRRSAWLVVFALVHAYLMLMPGDILFTYGLAAMLFYPLRKLRSRTLILLGCLMLLVLLGAELAALSEAPDARPSAEALQSQIDERRSGYLTNFVGIAPVNFHAQTVGLITSELWAALEMMLIGAGLFKLGVFSAERSRKVYLLLVLLGYGTGLLVRGAAVAYVLTSGLDPAALQIRHVVYDLGRLPIAMGHTGAVMFVCRVGWLPGPRRRLGAVGRMALTNYLMQPLLMVLFFYGVGLGRFGMLERAELYYVVAAVWLLQLALSPSWLERFRFGPAEWLWRSLTYWKIQPMRRVGG